MRQVQTHFRRFRGWLSRQQRWRVGLLSLLLAMLLLRSAPYLVPITTQDLTQEQRALDFSDRNGLPLGTLLSRDDTHTVAVPLEQISPHFINAIIAAEDKRFYQHGPVDLIAIARASLEALQAQEIVSGASTITMQLARMIKPGPRTCWQKLHEIWNAWRLAAGMDRDQILAAYINRLPMGSNLYGVEAAARTYFGVPAADLSIAQASLLAGLPNDPIGLDPYFYWDALKQRQGYVLNRLVQDGYLTQAQANHAAAEDLSPQLRQQGILAAPHFLFWLADQLPDHSPAHIRTTLDLSLQKFVEAQIHQLIRALAPHNVRQAAALVIDSRTGEILSYVGSPSYFAGIPGNRNDGVQALRQPGSTLKPFLYQLALDQKIIRPNTILADVPTHYPIPGAQLYSPVDYSGKFHGPVRVRIALANSLNIPAVRILEKVGVENFLNHLHQLGFEHLSESPEHYGLGLALGSGEVSLWELARAYWGVARQVGEMGKIGEQGSGGAGLDMSAQPNGEQGRYRQPITHYPLPITHYPRPTTHDPRPTTHQNPKSKIQNPKSTLSLITHILSDRHARALEFGVDSVLSLPFPAAVKTGTSSDFRDTWTVGFTTDYTVAAWVGNFNGEPMRQVSGVTGAAPLWARIMLHLHEQRGPGTFPTPTGMLKRPICALTGLKPTKDCPSVVEEFFYPEDLVAYGDSPESGHQSAVNETGNATLPNSYNDWIANQNRAVLPHQPRILSPQEDDYFVLPPGDEQRLIFKVAGPQGQPVEWRLNGKSIKTASNNIDSNTLFWSMQPGLWTLEVRSGEWTDQVQFQVQPPEYQNMRRGFSVVPPRHDR
ncbi:MAG: transglycosylase domain-containing protein [Cyanobacteria bacterium J06635_1]